MSFELESIPDRLRTRPVCEAAVRCGGNNLRGVPKEFLTYDLCLEAIKNGLVFPEFVPEEYYTDELLKAFAIKSGDFIDRLPKRFLSEELCILAMENNYSVGSIFSHIPNVTERIVKVFLKNASMSNATHLDIKHIPSNLYSEEVVLGIANICYQYVPFNFPEHLRTNKFIKQLVEMYPQLETEFEQNSIKPID